MTHFVAFARLFTHRSTSFEGRFRQVCEPVNGVFVLTDGAFSHKIHAAWKLSV
jgi:hypothetical protein